MKKLFSQMGLGVLVGLLTTGCSLFGRGQEDGPSYLVILREDSMEIRKYSSMIMAKTTIRGSFKDAQGEGFRILAGYIFGKNKTNQKISMTSPVLTLSVGENRWTMFFSMPSHFTVNTLPIPTDERIQIEKTTERFFAAVRYSGLWDEARNEEETKKLKDWLRRYPEYEHISNPIFAAYNPPWTVPFLRRNEMLIELRIKNYVE
jgi:hypothetical protein